MCHDWRDCLARLSHPSLLPRECRGATECHQVRGHPAPWTIIDMCRRGMAELDMIWNGRSIKVKRRGVPRD